MIFQYFNIPTICPVCGSSTIIEISDSGVKNLVCTNPSCEGKLVNKLDHFCSKKGLDIKGLSKATLEKLIEWEWVSSIEDLYSLHEHKDEWIKIIGFGEKSVNNILSAIENSKHCTLASFISSAGIPLIGVSVSKELVKHIDSWEDFRQKIDKGYDFTIIDGFGEVMNDSLHEFDYTHMDNISKYFEIENPKEEKKEQTLEGKVFVITGKLKSWKNRDALKAEIEAHGGKVAGSVTKKTDYLINNDNESTTAKNKTAKDLGIPVITEENFKKLFDF